MPLQNRVTPSGQLQAVSARGAWLGNRGILHDENKKIVAPWRHKAWVTCKLDFPAGTAPSSAQTTTRSFSSSTKPPLFQRVIGPALSVERTDITSSRRRGAPPIPKLRAASRPSRKLTRNYIPSAQFAAATKSHLTSSSRIFRRAPS